MFSLTVEVSAVAVAWLQGVEGNKNASGYAMAEEGEVVHPPGPEWQASQSKGGGQGQKADCGRPCNATVLCRSSKARLRNRFRLCPRSRRRAMAPSGHLCLKHLRRLLLCKPRGSWMFWGTRVPRPLCERRQRLPGHLQALLCRRWGDNRLPPTLIEVIPPQAFYIGGLGSQAADVSSCFFDHDGGDRRRHDLLVAAGSAKQRSWASWQ